MHSECYYFLVMAGNSTQFWILRSYTLLLKSPVLICFWYVHRYCIN